MLGLPHLMQLQKVILDKGTERADARDQPSGNGGLPPLSSTSVRGMMPMLLLQAVQCALHVNATKVLTGLTQFCDATHLGLPPVEGPHGDRREFLHAFNIMLETVLPERSSVPVEAPLIDLDYAGVIKLANRLGVPLERTWTCQSSGPRPCHRCERCEARGRAFVDAGFVDPLGKALREPM